MTRINLLPHREEKRKARQRQLAMLAGLTSAMALALSALLWVVFTAQVDNQKSRNQYLSGEIAKLDKQIEEIRKIREETASLLAKKQVVEGLQSNRSEPVQLLDQMLRQLPEGLYLKSIRQSGNKINVTGYTQSQARVSAFMRNIEASPFLENPNLIEIKAVTVAGQRANEFNLDFFVKRVKADDKSGAKKGAQLAPAKPPEKKV
ncbi:MAG: PilN domain-containing protein [Rhodocyclaceae bacterium]|jgi:type IV pilus assembly protein PilN|nr:PilN domain-containing protein [Rhodocyclaceae bacterium]MCA3017380.1 PilN domain-containing protein [Rhodocyclaceae bacterium]MCA3021742.1 PilN domain-containing protein [Rhodocyclaceae bacterium]MCA3023962.1 PilN domain-containing protein [Rhodocyclaceae bacterium]MCA3027816.1 PilN domain-containing protein [Rhodocyclaceae bacterium]